MGNFVRTRTHTRETRTYSHRYGLGTGFFTGFLQVIFFHGFLSILRVQWVLQVISTRYSIAPPLEYVHVHTQIEGRA
jgi:hypothetical protein